MTGDTREEDWTKSLVIIDRELFEVRCFDSLTLLCKVILYLIGHRVCFEADQRLSG